MTRRQIFVIAVIFVLSSGCFGQWITPHAAQWAIDEFRNHEGRKSQDRRFHGYNDVKKPSKPFITGDAFRELCQPHICETLAACSKFRPESVKDGQCVFIKSDHFDYFVKNKAVSIPNRYVLVSHNGDISAPDGQNDTMKPDMPVFVTSDILKKEYERGRLLAHHAQNLWWVNWKVVPKPPYMHCLPIGFENRQYNIGKRVGVYIDALRSNIVEASSTQRNVSSSLSDDKKPLLLVAFGPTSQDRQRLLEKFAKMKGSSAQKDKEFMAEITVVGAEQKLTHSQWLKDITKHKFVLAPFGHGLDTHRVSEILTMGGIPVMRRSSISSCYDDSDNVVSAVRRNSSSGRSIISTSSSKKSSASTTVTADAAAAVATVSSLVLNGNNSSSSNSNRVSFSRRGSLPVVILDSWDELTKERLLLEWQRIQAVPHSTWDWKRLFVYQWIDRIRATSYIDEPLSTSNVAVATAASTAAPVVVAAADSQKVGDGKGTVPGKETAEIMIGSGPNSAAAAASIRSTLRKAHAAPPAGATLTSSVALNDEPQRQQTTTQQGRRKESSSPTKRKTISRIDKRPDPPEQQPAAPAAAAVSNRIQGRRPVSPAG